MKTALLTTATLAALALAGFTLVGASAPASAAASTALAPVTYTIDAVHSTVIFSLTHLNTSRSYGRFEGISGTIVFDAEKPEASKVDIEIAVDSIDTANEARDTHLRGADFFDVKQFPKATFQSTKIEKKGEKSWAVTGKLALHGVKKDVTIPLELVGTGKGQQGEALIGFHGTFSVQRADFGMEYGKGALGEQVDLIVSIEAGAAAAK